MPRLPEISGWESGREIFNVQPVNKPGIILEGVAHTTGIHTAALNISTKTWALIFGSTRTLQTMLMLFGWVQESVAFTKYGGPEVCSRRSITIQIMGGMKQVKRGKIIK